MDLVLRSASSTTLQQYSSNNVLFFQTTMKVTEQCRSITSKKAKQQKANQQKANQLTSVQQGQKVNDEAELRREVGSAHRASTQGQDQREHLEAVGVRHREQVIAGRRRRSPGAKRDFPVVPHPRGLLLDGLDDVEADLPLQVGQLRAAEEDSDHVLLQVRLLVESWRRKKSLIL